MNLNTQLFFALLVVGSVVMTKDTQGEFGHRIKSLFKKDDKNTSDENKTEEKTDRNGEDIESKEGKSE